MKRLLPQFKDLKVCRKCGAPAELLGEPWDHDGILDWFASPIEIECKPHAYGAESRTKSVPDGRKTIEKHYHVQVFTHVCVRNAYEAPDGTYSDADAHKYACGTLMARDTVRVRTDQLPGRCFDVELVES